ncbi:MAG: hypothetical protein GC165_05140 [Armatimonadetes bacterium]|nr:hypothetical protein [Armatimonadota bacterium]
MVKLSLFEAILHLQELGLDQCAVFQIKPDSPNCHVKPMVLDGKYIDVEDELCKLNAQGCAIFVQVNGGERRGDRHIRELNWLYADLDRAKTLPKLPFEPHMVIKTKRGFHLYWRIVESRDKDLWKAVERALVALIGADSAAKQVSQVLRVAGFEHRKGEPYQICIHSWNPNMKPYDLADLRDQLGVSIVPKTGKVKTRIEPIGKAEKRFWFPIVGYHVTQQKRKIAKAKVGCRWLTVRHAAFSLGHYVHLGLDQEYLRRALLLAVKNAHWPDEDLRPEALSPMIEQNIVNGIKDGLPILKPELVAKANAIRAGERALERAKDSVKTWPDVLTTDQAWAIMRPEGSGQAWTSDKQVSYQTSKFLQQNGYQPAGRSNGKSRYRRRSDTESGSGPWS